MDLFLWQCGIAIPKLKFHIKLSSKQTTIGILALCYFDHPIIPHYHKALTAPLKGNIYTIGQLLVGFDPQQSAG